jgi:hypothetical protein
MLGEVSVAFGNKEKKKKVCGDGIREDRKRQHH